MSREAVEPPVVPAPPLAAPPPAAEFEALLRGVLDRAYGTALRLTGSRDDAEDLVQEAALNAFRGFGGFRPGTNFRAWFFRILMNAFYATHRRRRPTTGAVALDDADPVYLYQQARAAGLLDEGQDPAARTLSRMAVDDVARALESLPEEFRAVSTLYFMEDLSYQEIADAVGVPVGTVRSRLHRGRRLLQKALWTLAEERGIAPRADGGRTDGEP